MKLITTTQPALEAAAHINTQIDAHTGDTLCFLAGGSALDIYAHINLSSDTKGRTIFCMGDERWSREVKNNNFLQLCVSLPDFVKTYRVVDTAVLENETHAAYASRINAEIEKIILRAHNLQIICVLGMGADGHTASIFPIPEERFQEAYDIDSTYVPVSVASLTIDSRASLTPKFILEQAHHVIGYISGIAKAAKLEQLINEDLNLYEMPAQIFKQHKDAVVFTDIT